MTHLAIFSGNENGVPYVLAAIDRKTVECDYVGSVREIVGFELAKKFAVVPEKKLIILGDGLRSACDTAMHEIIVRAHERAYILDLAIAGGNGLSEALTDNRAAIVAVGMHDGTGVLAYVEAHADAEHNTGKVHFKRFISHGNFYISSVYDTYVEDTYNRFSGHVPIAKALEAIVLSQEQAAVKHPEAVSKEFDVLLLSPKGKPAELQICYEWGRPVVKRAKPITKTFVPWEAGNRTETRMFNDAPEN